MVLCALLAHFSVALWSIVLWHTALLSFGQVCAVFAQLLCCLSEVFRDFISDHFVGWRSTLGTKLGHCFAEQVSNEHVIRPF